MKTQRETFLQSEGDEWYARNKAALAAEDKARAHDPVLAMLHSMPHIRPRSILEVGCGNGWRLEALRQMYASANCTGIEPSATALKDGALRYPELQLHRGTADELPFETGSFDLVMLGFCLYLCDRTDLFRIAAETDRVLGDGGTIIVFDFCPPIPYRNVYVHQPGLHAYKMDYARMFLWNPAYVRLAHSTVTHAGFKGIEDPNERLGVTVLRKDLATAFPPNPYTRAT